MAANVSLMMSMKMFEDVAGLSSGNSFNYSIEDFSRTLNGDSTPEIDTVYGGLIALSAGAVTVDLTALARTGRTALNLTGKTIYAARIKNLGANPMTFKDGTSNGYAMFTATNGHVVRALGELMQWAPSGFGAVGATDLSIEVSGTLTQSFYLLLAAGTAA